ncbi:FAD/NAD(P)-binding protein [Herbaspirillum autotrophicum]|uniref:FAD/NAD(P)-binding protein n=1 Tax=Herbaspirillum autotrophicum TaxID=180195 RepID=UPI00067D1840|nr:FAD/NAD(P)-binding protein [Herbaspirillum autotrophicum]
MTTISRQRIAIIGGGFAGAVTALKLIEACTRPLHLIIFESTHELGRGIAYSTRNNDHLINGPARMFGLYPENPGHLATWLAQHAAQYGWQPPAGVAFDNSFPPRWIFGIYVQATLQAALLQDARRVHIEKVKDRVTDLQESNRGYLITAASGDTWNADKVVLATGLFRADAASTFTIAPELQHDPRLIDDVWRDDAWRAVRADSSLLLIGSSLTALDAMLNAEKHGFNGNYFSISRRGLQVKRREDADPWPDVLAPDNLPRTLRALLRQVQAARHAIRAGGHNWQRLPGAVRPHLPQLWTHASLKDRQRFLRHLRPYWEIALHRAAPESGYKLEKIVAAGRYQQLTGRITAVRSGPGQKIDVLWAQRSDGTSHSILVDRVVNAQGYEFDWRKIDDALIRNLLKQQLVQPHETGFGIAADPASGAVIGRDGRASRQLFAVGHPLRGAVWESNSIPEQLTGATATALALAALIEQETHADATESLEDDKFPVLAGANLT